MCPLHSLSWPPQGRSEALESVPHNLPFLLMLTSPIGAARQPLCIGAALFLALAFQGVWITRMRELTRLNTFLLAECCDSRWSTKRRPKVCALPIPIAPVPSLIFLSSSSSICRRGPPRNQPASCETRKKYRQRGKWLSGRGPASSDAFSVNSCQRANASTRSLKESLIVCSLNLYCSLISVSDCIRRLQRAPWRLLSQRSG